MTISGRSARPDNRLPRRTRPDTPPEWMEALEPRLLLSAEPTFSHAVITNVATPQPQWFEVLVDTPDVGPTVRPQMDSFKQEDGSTVQCYAGQWIVQVHTSLLDEAMGVADVEPFLAAGGDEVEFEITRGLGAPGLVVIETPDASIDTVWSWLGHNELIRHFSPNAIVTSTAEPNDPLYLLGDLWGLNNEGQDGGIVDADIDAPEAWDITTGSSDVVVAVTDTGVDYQHPDLAANMWTNPGEIPDNGIDDDGNFFIDDVYGWDFGVGDNDPMDDADDPNTPEPEYGHGTHVAGTIGAVGDNDRGVVGVNWDVSIMALKIADAFGDLSTAAIIAANEYAAMMANRGVNLVATNNSYGGYFYSQAMRDSIEQMGEAGILFVASAGNEAWDNDSSLLQAYPASYSLDNIISVAATDRRDRLASFSNYGATSVDLGAPGVSIRSTYPGMEYRTFQGTSMAAPHVTGVVALAAAYNPDASAEEIKFATLNGADFVPSLAGRTLTGGRLNALGTLSLLTPASIGGSLWNDVDGDGISDPGEAPLEGLTVFIDRDNDGLIGDREEFTTSDAAGNYTLTGLRGGEYRLRVQLPCSGGRIITSPLAGYLAVTLDVGENETGADFGIYDARPTATPQTVTGDEDVALQISLAGDDSHFITALPNGNVAYTTPTDELLFEIVTQPAHGQVTLADGVVSYTPDENWHGDDSFSFIAIDTGNPIAGFNGGGENVGRSEPATVSITIDPVNDKPVADGDIWAVANERETGDDHSVLITLSGTDVETDLDDLTFVIVTPPTRGLLTQVSGAVFRYQPFVGEVGLDTFEFLVRDDGDPAGSHDNDLDSDPATVEIGIARREPFAEGFPYFFAAGSEVGAVILDGFGLGTLYDASWIAGFEDRVGISSIELIGSTDSTSLIVNVPDAGTARVNDIHIDGPLKALRAPNVIILGDVAFENGAPQMVDLGDLVGDGHEITISDPGLFTSRPVTMTLASVDDLAINSDVPFALLLADHWTDTDGTPDVVVAPWVGELLLRGDQERSLSGDFSADLDLTGFDAGRFTLGSAEVRGTASGDWDIVGTVGKARLLGGADGFTIGQTQAPTTIDLLEFGDAADATVTVTDVIDAIKAQRWQSGAVNVPRVNSLMVTGNRKAGIDGDFGADLTLTGLADGKATLGRAKVDGRMEGDVSIVGDTGRLRMGGIGGQFDVNGDVARLRLEEALALIPPSSGSIGTFDVGGSAKIKAGNQRFDVEDMMLYSRINNEYSVEELRHLNEAGLWWQYTRTFSGTQGRTKLTDFAAVENAPEADNLRVYHGPTGYGKVIDVWNEDENGLNADGISVSWPDGEYVQLGFPDTLATSPEMLEMRNTYRGSSRFDSAWQMDNRGLTLSGIASGTARVKSVMIDHEQITTPAGTFWAVRGKTIVKANGKSEFDYKGRQITGRFNFTYKETWYAAPELGTIMADSEVSVRVNGGSKRFAYTVRSDSELLDTGMSRLDAVPAYENWFGNIPTAAGMIVGYWDGVDADGDGSADYADLIAGDASTQTDAVNEAIASSGDGIYTSSRFGYSVVTPATAGTGHIGDYALYNGVNDAGSANLETDLSELGNAHTDDCLADFLLASRSAENLGTGEADWDDVAAGLTAYVTAMGYSATTTAYDWDDFSMQILRDEIDAGRPMLFHVDSLGRGVADTAVTVVGYDLATDRYGFYDTNTDEIQWRPFRDTGWGDWYGIESALAIQVGA